MTESIIQRDYRGTHRGIHEFTCVCAANGSLTSTTANDRDGNVIEWRLEEISLLEINPGTVAPSDGAWDLTLLTESGVDILGAQGANLDESDSVFFKPEVAGTAVDSFPLWGQLTLAVAQNVVDSAEFVFRFYFDINDRIY